MCKFAPIFPFKTTEIMKEPKAFLVISEGIEMKQWNEIG